MRLAYVTLSDPYTPPTVAIDAMQSLGHSAFCWSGSADALVQLAATDAIVVEATRNAQSAEGYCRRLGELDVGIPIIVIVTAQSAGLLSASWGVSDFVLDTSGPIELLVRITRARYPNHASSARCHRWDRYVLNHEQMTVSSGSTELALTKAEHALLTLFFEHPDRVFSRRELRQRCWSDHDDVSHRAITTFVCRLRRKLAHSGPVIATVRNVGYGLAPRPGDSGSGDIGSPQAARLLSDARFAA